VSGLLDDIVAAPDGTFATASLNVSQLMDEMMDEMAAAMDELNSLMEYANEWPSNQDRPKPDVGLMWACLDRAEAALRPILANDGVMAVPKQYRAFKDAAKTIEAGRASVRLIADKLHELDAVETEVQEVGQRLNHLQVGLTAVPDDQPPRRYRRRDYSWIWVFTLLGLTIWALAKYGHG